MYVWTSEGWLYVAVVLGLFSRRIVGWSMKSQMTADLVTDALVMAIWRRGPGAELLHHSDEGSQYASGSFQGLLRGHGIECSMGRRGDCWYNAVMESFFSSMKMERIDRRTYRTRDDVRAEVFEYIERCYNPRFLPFRVRRHFSWTSAAMKNAGVFTNLPLNNRCSDQDDSGLSLDASAMNCPPCRRKTLSVMDRRAHDASVSRAAPIQMAFR